jgi:CRISPR-associated protein Cmr6
MSIAAVPGYLGQDFKEASPGLRFGQLLPIWTNRDDQVREVTERSSRNSRESRELREELQRQGMDEVIGRLVRQARNPLPGLWEKNDFAARDAWRKITALTDQDRRSMKALATRQAAQAASLGADRVLSLAAQCIAPFATGLGNEHPLENGFAFLNPYGLPYLAGSGVKGVLRRAAQELAGADWGDTGGWSQEPAYTLHIGKEAVALSMLDVLFGREPPNGDSHHVRGVLSFWDVIPQLAGDRLCVEIMTPHQTHYYQHGQSPHESGQPTPIFFLAVPPRSGFVFHVACDLPRLGRLAGELAEGERWKALLQAAFAHAFDWLGFGAKTAVGYGAMAIDTTAMERYQAEEAERLAKAEQEAARQTEEARLAELPPIERAISEALAANTNPDLRDHLVLLNALKQKRWEGADARVVAERIRKLMIDAKIWKERSEKKDPAKDKDHQRTLEVLKWLG